MADSYSKAMLGKIRSLLGSMDRNRHSATYGCCDRDYWLHKEKDFSCADKQSLALTLAILYKKTGSAEFYRNKKIKEWAIAGMKFWTKISDKDGSYSEWYPHEHSYVSTAFSLYAVSEAYLLLRDEIKKGEFIKKAFIKAGKWLLEDDEFEASNQEAVSICSLYNVYLATEMEIFRIGAERKLNILEKMQSKEGWLSEYGGFDAGYMSVSIEYLAKYYVKSKNKRALRILKKSLDFLKYFMAPVSTGGVYSSRHTSFIHPTGFEILAKYSRTAQSISDILRGYMGKNTPNWDDRYWLYIGYSYLESECFKSKINNKKTELPYYKKFSKLFNESGIFIKSNSSFYIIVSLFKGSIKVYDKKREEVLLSDSGIVCVLSNAKAASTNYLNRNIFDINRKELTIEGDFYYINQVRQTIFKMLFFRFILMLTGRSNLLSKMLKNFLRKLLITKRRKAPASFKRQLVMGENQIMISDSIFIKGHIKLTRVSIGDKFSFLTVPSSSYFDVEDLAVRKYDLNKKEISELNDKKNFKHVRTFIK